MIANKLHLVMLVLLPHDGMLLVDPGKYFCNYCLHFCGLCYSPNYVLCTAPTPNEMIFRSKRAFF